MGLRDGLVRLAGGQVEQERAAFPPGWLVAQLEAMRFGGNVYTMPTTTYGRDEKPSPVTGAAAYGSSVVFAVEQRRINLFRQTRFAWKRYGAGPRPMAADLFTSSALAPLDNPGKLLARMLLDADLYGNAFAVRDGDVVRLLRPQWCTIVLGSQRQPTEPDVAWDAVPIGLIYAPSGRPDQAETWAWDEVAHFAPAEDPDARWRGMSWMASVLMETANTEAYNQFLSKFWQNGATPNSVVTFPADVQRETVEAFRDLFMQRHQGVDRAFRTAFLGGGADLRVIGSNLGDLAAKDISADQFARICAAGGVPPVIVTIVPGLESASTYANYTTAHRAFADLTIRPLWIEAVRALSKIVPAPAGAELWYDVSGVSALQADALDDAQVMAQQAMTMRTLVDGGFVPESVIAAVTTGDMSRLVHSGLLSVQTQAPGAGAPALGG
jgi:phage portal protein BeeE